MDQSERIQKFNDGLNKLVEETGINFRPVVELVDTQEIKALSPEPEVGEKSEEVVMPPANDTTDENQTTGN